MARKNIEWYEPSIGNANWNIKSLSKEERENLRNRLVMGTIHTEEEYQTVIGYMYKKFPHLMDITGKVKNPWTGEETNNTSIQWNYTPHKHKVNVYNEKDPISNNYNMYAFVYYDKERDYEPICFAGSYFKHGNVDLSLLTYPNELDSIKEFYKNRGIDIPEDNMISTALGEGYVMFCDPDYRRLGLGSFSWNAESQLYRDCANSDIRNSNNGASFPMIIPIQAEIQNEYSVKSTIGCFPPSNKYPKVEEENQNLFGEHSKHLLVTSNGRVKNDGSRCQIRLLMNYQDEDMIESFNSMPENMKELYNSAHWEFLDRESKKNNMSVEEYKKELIKPWNK